MKHQAISVLERVVALIDERVDGRRTNRITELLRPHDSKGEKDWFFCVPEHFNDALDIQLTARKKKDEERKWFWMQGGWFYFKSGDVLYDSADAYENWQGKGMHFHYCLQVGKATAATPATKTTERNPGLVEFSVYLPDKKSGELSLKGKYSVTQDDFVKFLISGSSKVVTLHGKKEDELWPI